MTEQMLLQYTRIVEFLGQALGPDYEIVLHEILPEQSRVAAIANGGISGRSVGAPITNAALRMIIQKQYEANADEPIWVRWINIAVSCSAPIAVQSSTL